MLTSVIMPYSHQPVREWCMSWAHTLQFPPSPGFSKYFAETLWGARVFGAMSHPVFLHGLTINLSLLKNKQRENSLPDLTGGPLTGELSEELCRQGRNVVSGPYLGWSIQDISNVWHGGWRENGGTDLPLSSLREEHGKRSIHIFPYDPWSLCSLDLGVIASLMGPVSEHTGKLFKGLHRCAVKLVLKRSEMDVELNING